MKTHLFTEVGEYCARWTSPVDELLTALTRETHLKTVAPQMLSGAHQGKFLQMLSALLQPQRILEIGSFTGYSAICLARGLADGGILEGIEMDPEYAAIFNKYVKEAGLQDRIHLHTGDAKVILKQMKEKYDLIFIDAGKLEYPIYYAEAVRLIRPRGIILLDNLLWEGKVLEHTDDAEALTMRELAKTIYTDSRVECILLPLRDGLMMVRRV